jgi:hypothetical protein
MQVVWHEAVREDCKALLTRGVQHLLHRARDLAFRYEHARSIPGATRYEISMSAAIGEAREAFWTGRHAQCGAMGVPTFGVGGGEDDGPTEVGPCMTLHDCLRRRRHHEDVGSRSCRARLQSGLPGRRTSASWLLSTSKALVVASSARRLPTTRISRNRTSSTSRRESTAARSRA